MRHALIGGVVAGAAALQAGCAWYDSPAELPDDGLINVDVVVDPRTCRIQLPTKENECEGVGKADGVACGQQGDTVTWALDRDAGWRISFIRFAEPSPCEESQPVVDEPTGTWSCTIRPADGDMAATEDSDLKHPEVFAYDVEVDVGDKTCSLDPYFIRSKR